MSANPPPQNYPGSYVAHQTTLDINSIHNQLFNLAHTEMADIKKEIKALKGSLTAARRMCVATSILSVLMLSVSILLSMPRDGGMSQDIGPSVTAIVTATPEKK